MSIMIGRTLKKFLIEEQNKLFKLSYLVMPTVGRVLAWNAQRPKFDPQLSMVVHTYKPNI